MGAPQTHVRVGGERHPVRARVLEGTERATEWPRVAAYRDYERYEKATPRSIPLVLLERVYEATGSFSATTLTAGSGRWKPFSASSPTGVTSTWSSTAACTRWLRRI